MTEAPYPKRGGKGRTEFLPKEMPGVRVALLRPYGGMTGEEWTEQDPKPSQFEDKRPKIDSELLGIEIHNVAQQHGITASEAADLILDPTRDVPA